MRELATRRLYFKAVLFFKIQNQLAPSYLQELSLPTVSSVTNYNLPNLSNIHAAKARTSKYKSPFFPATSRTWNMLPNILRSIENLPVFKDHLTRHML